MTGAARHMGPLARRWAAIAAAIGAGVIVTALGGLLIAPPSDQAEPASTPTLPADDAIVVANLGATANLRSPELVAALRAAREAPEDSEAARAAARLLIAEGRRGGDSRLVGAAIGVLRPHLDQPEAETLYLAATARQYQHDFEGAMSLLDQAINLDTQHVNALLTRATLKTVLGRIGASQEDCARVAVLRPDVGFLCQSTALIVTGEALVVRDRLSAILARPGLIDPSLETWATGLLGEIALLQGDDAEAHDQLAEVLARDPGALRERLLLADLLLRSDEAAAVLPLLAEAPETDGVLLRRALAARALGAPDEGIEATLSDRVQLNRDLGLDAHAREDALYYLRVASDPASALDRALANWALQHEVEDAQLLLDAATAASRPEEALPVLEWMEREGIAVPALRVPDAVRAVAP